MSSPSRGLGPAGIALKGEVLCEQAPPIWPQVSTLPFYRMAAVLHWIMVNECGIPDVIHYLDNFLILVRSIQKCDNALKFACCLKTLGYPLLLVKS